MHRTSSFFPLTGGTKIMLYVKFFSSYPCDGEFCILREYVSLVRKNSCVDMSANNLISKC